VRSDVVTNQIYDTIVVGARCAGASTAMLLARLGYRVLVVDRATFPSDTISTHLIHPPGLAALDSWGLLPEVVASGCPAIDTYSFDFGAFTIEGSPAGAGFESRTRHVVPSWTRSSSMLPESRGRRCARASASRTS
jgi:2-polyprenyl-6-methoxyphenol hydroxylase-like FAD-dependent oxidoreductase